MTDQERKARVKRVLAHPLTVVTCPVWVGDDGYLRLGRTGDMVTMLDAIGVRTRL